MARSLVIVESPAKAKTINKYLGSDYIVKSSVGHIRDLPTGARAVHIRTPLSFATLQLRLHRLRHTVSSLYLALLLRQALHRAVCILMWTLGTGMTISYAVPSPIPVYCA